MYLLTFKKHKHVKNYLGGVWEVVGKLYTTRKPVAEKAKALYESVDKQRCDVSEVKGIRGINMSVAYLDEMME